MITWNDYSVTLTQEAYIADNRYHAHATDIAGNKYLVVWTPCDNHLELDADMACNWSAPDYILFLGEI